MNNALKVHVLDWMVNLFLIFPAVICYWRGIWDLYTYYVLQGREPLNHWVTTAVGCTFILAYYVYPLLDRCIHNLPELTKTVLLRSNFYLWGLLSMAYWKGMWELLDFYLYQYGWQGGAIGLAASYPLLVLTGTSRTIIFTPFSAEVDWRQDALDSSTVFESKLRADFGSFTVYTLDSLFTQFFINTLSIVCWRSMLMMIAEIPFPEGSEDFICLGIGIFSSLVLFALEIPLASIGIKLSSDVAAVKCKTSHRLSHNGIKEKTEIGKMVCEKQSEVEPVKDHKFGLKTWTLDHWGNRPQDVRADEYTKEENKNTSMIEKFLQSSSDQSRKVSQMKPSDFFNNFNLRGLKSRLYEQTIFLLVFIAESFLWEGAWNLNCTYVISDLKLGGWVNHVLGTFLLFQMGLTSDSGSCGCVKDDPVLGTFEVKSMPYLYPNKFLRLVVEEAIEEEMNSKDKLRTPTTVASLATPAAANAEEVVSASSSVDSIASLT